jgi:hypothetical protein
LPSSLSASAPTHPLNTLDCLHPALTNTLMGPRNTATSRRLAPPLLSCWTVRSFFSSVRRLLVNSYKQDTQQFKEVGDSSLSERYDVLFECCCCAGQVVAIGRKESGEHTTKHNNAGRPMMTNPSKMTIAAPPTTSHKLHCQGSEALW